MSKSSKRAAFPSTTTALVVAVLLLLAACGGGDEATDVVDQSTDEPVTEPAESTEGTDETGSTESEVATPEALEPGTKVRLLTHDSFSVSDGLFDNFTLETGIDVEVVNAGDAGELVSRAILTAGQPEADVLFGVDNTFLQRALDADIFTAYESSGLATVPDELQLDPENRVTPIDYGDVCLNYWKEAFPDGGPSSLADLTRPEFASTFVTMDPEASSPGFAFLLATIATYGDDGWQDYWQQLADGGVTVTSGWSDAYYGEFVAGGGDKAIRRTRRARRRASPSCTGLASRGSTRWRRSASCRPARREWRSGSTRAWRPLVSRSWPARSGRRGCARRSCSAPGSGTSSSPKRRARAKPIWSSSARTAGGRGGAGSRTSGPVGSRTRCTRARYSACTAETRCPCSGASAC